MAAASSPHRQASAKKASTAEESGTQQGPWGMQMPSYRPSTEALKWPDMRYIVKFTARRLWWHHCGGVGAHVACMMHVIVS